MPLFGDTYMPELPIKNIQDMFNWIINLLIYVGWSGVIIGVGYSIFRIITTLMIVDESEKMEVFRKELTRGLLIIVMGIFILGSGYIITVVSDLFGADLDPSIPDELEGGIG